MIRVLHIVRDGAYGGAERVQELLAQRLPELGFEVGFARLGKNNALSLLEEARRGNYALIHTHSARGLLLGRLIGAVRAVPVVHHLHGQRHILPAQLERFGVSRSVWVIAVSNSAKIAAQKIGIPAEHIRVVPNGIPVMPPPALRARPEHTWTLGIVARFRPRKGLEVLLEAIAILRTRGVETRLRVIGEFASEQYRAQMNALAQRLGVDLWVTWTGFTTDVPAELGRIDLFVLPSIRPEGWPLTVLEAMAAGAPVVGSRIAGIADIIEDERSGILCEPGDPRALADAIGAVISGEHDWNRLREHGYARAMQFSDRAMASGVAAIYHEALAQGRPR